MMLYVLTACSGMSPAYKSAEEAAPSPVAQSAPSPGAPPPPAAEDGAAMGGEGMVMEAKRAKLDAPSEEDKRNEPEKPAADGKPAARSWFPETFLWRPSLATDASGTATVSLTVPDTLTSWRILALGHTAGGAQGGDVATFQSTLPAYVELRVPSFLVAGDELRLPMLVVNQGAQPLSAPLALSVRGGAGGASGTLTVAAGGNAVREAAVTVGGPGQLGLSARLGEIDAVERAVPIRPSGLAVVEERGGTLAATREVKLGPVQDGHDDGVVVTAFPGLLGFVLDEVASAERSGSGSLSDEVYRYSLAVQARALGAPADLAPVLRAQELRAWQKLVRSGRTPDPWTAALIRAGLGAPSKDTSAGALADRLDAVIEDGQQPDGLWGLAAGASIDRVLAHTAWCAWNAGETTPGLLLRAGGAFARHAPRLSDANLAAWALLSGSVEEPLRAKLVETLKGALVADERGGSYLPGTGTRPDGLPMSTLDATALAALALRDDAGTASELVTWILGHRGEADGFGRLLVLRAFSTVLGGEVPAEVVITLKADGVELGRATLDPSQPHAPVHLRAPLDGNAHTLTLESTPPVPGLAWTLTRTTWVDTVPPRPNGLDAVVGAPALVRNQPATISLSVTAPSGSRVDLDVGLPAGVSVEPSALAALVGSGQARGAWQEDGRIHLDGCVVSNGAWATGLPVTGTFSGRLHAAPTRVVVEGRPQEPLIVSGAVWNVL